MTVTLMGKCKGRHRRGESFLIAARAAFVFSIVCVYVCQVDQTTERITEN